MMDIWEKTLDWKPSPQQQELFQSLYELIIQGNRQLNLTRITNPEDFWEKHLWDSLRGIKFLISQKNDQKIQVESELQQTKQRLTTANNRAYLMEARGDLYDTTVNLDSRNFGVANTRLEEAAAALSKVSDVNGSLNITKIKELQQAISKKDINVAVNLEQQRNTVLSYINVLNQLIAAEKNLIIPAPSESP
ncbi:MAG: RsmG family class I SAM-dependent methyltransferase [Rivularia sp. (in: cyanobacteria)]